MTMLKFTEKDFDVFQIDGLDARMEALKENIRPKLEGLAEQFTPKLSIQTGDELHAHVAKHARRTINPPNDTWVAFAANSRGYKMLPHFQIGLWGTHAFIWFAVIYEAPNKAEIGKELEDNLDRLYKEIPSHFVWSKDHTKPEVIPHEVLSKEELKALFQRLQSVKKAEILCGVKLPRDLVTKMSEQEFLKTIQDTFDHLIPLYSLR
ncbi:YktB family protein [Bacillus massiliglaciei]|uniref:YktB family protein n=1 Tax=Bacillus massiliglaciei TaxID=1816693 RepID=UPI000ADF0C82|nr:DUF1054 domain-containing protein [Bacillus massiliglaciei]